MMAIPQTHSFSLGSHELNLDCIDFYTEPPKRKHRSHHSRSIKIPHQDINIGFGESVQNPIVIEELAPSSSDDESRDDPFILRIATQLPPMHASPDCTALRKELTASIQQERVIHATAEPVSTLTKDTSSIISDLPAGVEIAQQIEPDHLRNEVHSESARDGLHALSPYPSQEACSAQPAELQTPSLGSGSPTFNQAFSPSYQNGGDVTRDERRASITSSRGSHCESTHQSDGKPSLCERRDDEIISGPFPNIGRETHVDESAALGDASKSDVVMPTTISPDKPNRDILETDSSDSEDYHDRQSSEAPKALTYSSIPSSMPQSAPQSMSIGQAGARSGRKRKVPISARGNNSGTEWRSPQRSRKKIRVMEPKMDGACTRPSNDVLPLSKDKAREQLDRNSVCKSCLITEDDSLDIINTTLHTAASIPHSVFLTALIRDAPDMYGTGWSQLLKASLANKLGNTQKLENISIQPIVSGMALLTAFIYNTPLDTTSACTRCMSMQTNNATNKPDKVPLVKKRLPQRRVTAFSRREDLGKKTVTQTTGISSSSETDSGTDSDSSMQMVWSKSRNNVVAPTSRKRTSDDSESTDSDADEDHNCRPSNDVDENKSAERAMTKQRRPWKDREEEILLEGVRQKESWAEIGKKIGRTVSGVSQRWRLMPEGKKDGMKSGKQRKEKE